MLGLQPTGGLTARVVWLGHTEGRRPIGAALHSSNEPSELSQWLSRWQHYKYRPDIIIIIIINYWLTTKK